MSPTNLRSGSEDESYKSRRTAPPFDEESRLDAVRRHQILDTPPDGTFDRITALAARIFNVPIAIVSIVDRDRIWFKSHYGIAIDEIPRDPGLCASAILQYEPWIVTDAQVDPRTLTNPLVAGSLGLRFYAGMPLVTPDAHTLGTICVIDKEPRIVTRSEEAILRDLAELVVHELELRLAAREIAAAETGRRRRIEGEKTAIAEEKTYVERLAKTLQRSLLPPELPEIPGAHLASAYLPSRRDEVGGDFYDVFPVSSRSWGVVIGDVCGKGPEAASLTALARYTLRAAATDLISPAEVLSKVNRVMALRESSSEGQFCTLAFARLKPKPGKMRVSIACGGHPRPLILRRNGTIQPVGGLGRLVGCFPESEFTVETKTLLPGDALVFYTDGVTEARRVEEFFGEDGLADTLATCTHASAEEIIDRITAAVEAFGHDARDDIALLVVKLEDDASHST